jgi:hypothetical protein
MVVCPTCRESNTEEAVVCVRCGNSLAPGFASRLPARRTEAERPQLEIQPPKQPSKWRPYMVLGVLGLILVGAGAFALLRPDPCRGTNFSSETFGYCIDVPDGWEAGLARFGADVTLDQFAPPTSSATVVVEAVDLQDGATLEDWSQFVRQRDEDAGLTPGAASETTLDGVGAVQWDVSVSGDNGQSFRMREVVAVSGGFGWRIALNDVTDGFDSSAVAFQDMIESWKFR